MYLHLFTIIVIIGSLTGKPIVARNVSDCSVTEDGILHYYGKHSVTRFEHECLQWSDLQTMYANIINEPNFIFDVSVKAAKNYCRNPNMHVDGPWCFVEDDDAIIMEQCDVCQSLAPRTTLPPNLGSIDDVNEDKGFFQNLRDNILRFGAYIREKFFEMVDHIKRKFKQMG